MKNKKRQGMSMKSFCLVLVASCVLYLLILFNGCGPQVPKLGERCKSNEDCPECSLCDPEGKICKPCGDYNMICYKGIPYYDGRPPATGCVPH